MSLVLASSTTVAMTCCDAWDTTVVGTDAGMETSGTFSAETGMDDDAKASGAVRLDSQAPVVAVDVGLTRPAAP